MGNGFYQFELNDFDCACISDGSLDYPLHSFVFETRALKHTPKINETDLFSLDIPEGCVMNKLLQPHNITYLESGQPAYKIACCLLKEKIAPA